MLGSLAEVIGAQFNFHRSGQVCSNHWSSRRLRSTVFLVLTLPQHTPPPLLPEKRKQSRLICQCCQPFSKRTLLSLISQIHSLLRVTSLQLSTPSLEMLAS